MKARTIAFALIMMLVLQGCFFETMMDDIFGWLPGYQSSSSGSSKPPATDINDDKPGFLDTIRDAISGDSRDDGLSDLEQNRIDNLEWNCDHIPNSVMNEEGTCVCKPGYGDWYGQCVRLQGTCKSDLDCGNGERSRCSGTDTKISYRCDIVNERCFPPETVSCKTDYGPDYVCSGGNCVQKIIK